MKSFLRKLGQQAHTANRLTVLMVVTSVLLLSIAGFGAWHVRRMHAQSEELLSMNIFSMQAAVELDLQIEVVRHWLDLYLWQSGLAEPVPSNAESLQTVAARRQNIDHWLQQSEEITSTPETQVLLTQIKQGLATFDSCISELKQLDRTIPERRTLAQKAESILEAEVLTPARKYLSIDESSLEASRNEAELQTRRLVRTLLGIGGFSALAAMISGYGLARTISRSLIQLRIPMLDVAGKLSEVAGDVVVSTKLDLSDLGPALEQVSAEVKSVVEQLQVRHQEMLHAEQLATAGQLAAGIAHEIRNPLMAMKMLVQAARRPDAAHLDLRDLKILDEEIRRLEVLLDEFLDFARPRPLKKVLVDIRTVAESTLTFLQHQADARDVILDCDVPSEPVLVNIDPPRIRQVLMNLLLNGIQVTPPGGSVRLTVDQVQNLGGLACRLQVSDDGPGLPRVTEERLFEPFYSTKETGLGLGLPVSQRIVKLHGGEIQLGGERSGGAVFVVLLPIPLAEQAELLESPEDQLLASRSNP